MGVPSHWNETAEILDRLARSNSEAALATVVRIAGSSYRRPGAKLLIESEGTTLGGVSGGCLEADVREIARGLLASGGARGAQLRRYDLKSDDDVPWGLGLGCAGEIDVFVQPIGERQRAVLDRVRELLRGDERFGVATVIEGGEVGATAVVCTAGRAGSLGDERLDQIALDRFRQEADSRLVEFDGATLFYEAFLPPPRLIVAGAGDDALPVVDLAAKCGFRVTVADHRPALLAGGRFESAHAVVECLPTSSDSKIECSGALAIVKTHSLAHDREWSRRLLDGGAVYVGLLGPRLRGETIRREIGAEGDARIFAPIGLDLGADGARQVAVSIVAELLAFVSSRAPRHLRESGEAIHSS